MEINRNAGEQDLPFHPLISEWFTETYGRPTAVQKQAWPLIAQGRHILAIAPTGSGKTLTAFLAALSRLAEGVYPSGKLTVLYVSPLKALNEDIKRNLLEPLNGIRAKFKNAGIPFPDIRAETRSGDTPQGERRRFLNNPPAILSLTPESLAILLLNPRGRQALSSVKYLILDEIHAVLNNKRGSFLSCQVDRLSLAAGEFQRISLSATIRPPEIAAEFSGGIDPRGQPRPVCVVNPHSEKIINFSVDFPGDELAGETGGNAGKRYRVLVDCIIECIKKNRTTLVFTDSRRRAERLALFINQEAGEKGIEGQAAWAHHGSLSKELRRSVEQRLADGRLPCVVATASLELGIDIGSIDEVILAGSPSSVSQTLQRIGRSGHGVGKTSRGRLIPFHGMDLLLAAAVNGAVSEKDIEISAVIENPLDVLAQIILSLCTEAERNVDELYNLLRRFYIFRNLNRSMYDRIVRMLAGLTEDKKRKGLYLRRSELKPRLYFDRITGTLTAVDGVLSLLYSSGGVITNRGYFSLRLSGGEGGAAGTKIGELDEEFVWERRIGDCFDFGSRSWRIVSIGPEAVEAVPLPKPANNIPFWKADTVFRSPVLVNRILKILDGYNSGSIIQAAGEITGLSDSSIFSLRSYLDSQRQIQGNIPLASSASITVEIIDDVHSTGDFYCVVIHNFRGGAVNYPFSLAVAGELEEKISLHVEAFPDDNGVLILLPRILDNSALEELVYTTLLSLGERMFRKRLEASGLFGSCFREAAERSLLLPKSGFGKRTPLWIMRQRSKRLFDAVMDDDSFPVTAEAWRSCLQDIFDMDGFRTFTADLHDRRVSVSFFHTVSPSPFSRDKVRQEINALMYEYDDRPDLRRPGHSGKQALSDSVIEEALGRPELRPKINAELAAGFISRLRRELPLWTAEDEISLSEWVKERIAVPLDEWNILTAALPEDLQKLLREDPSLGNKLKMIKRGNAALVSVVHREWEDIWEKEAVSLLGPWLRFEGPVPLGRVTEVFGISAAQAEDAVDALAETGELVKNVRAAEQADMICDRENLEFLLRLSRKKNRAIIKERPVNFLPPFLAQRQGLACLERDSAALPARDQNFPRALACFPAPVKLWETEFLAARIGSYVPQILEKEIREGRIIWYGDGKERAGFCNPMDIELAGPWQSSGGKNTDKNKNFISDDRFFDKPRDFWEIKEKLSAESRAAPDISSCVKAIWNEAWAGGISSDSWEPLRRGIETGFTPELTGEIMERHNTEAQAGIFGNMRRHVPRALRDRWRGGAPVAGNWFSLIPEFETERDPLDAEELNRDRVRLLLARWGVLCRPFLEKEPAAFSWSRLLPAIRRMELSGELMAGRFFDGINSLQFASPSIQGDFEKAEMFTGIYWMNCSDPASPAGLALESPDPRIPSRGAASRLCFRGTELAAVSQRNGKNISIYIQEDDSDLETVLSFLSLPRRRKVNPENKIVIETINGKSAALSEYAGCLKAAGFLPDRGKLYLW
jgi:ATP-dependent Lhr-like helicase